MGSLIEEISNESAVPTNKVTKFILTLSIEDQEDLDKVMKDESIKTVAIHRVLTRRGFDGKYGLLAEFRRALINVAS